MKFNSDCNNFLKILTCFRIITKFMYNEWNKSNKFWSKSSTVIYDGWGNWIWKYFMSYKPLKSLILTIQIHIQSKIGISLTKCLGVLHFSCSNHGNNNIVIKKLKN